MTVRRDGVLRAGMRDVRVRVGLLQFQMPLVEAVDEDDHNGIEAGEGAVGNDAPRQMEHDRRHKTTRRT